MCCVSDKAWGLCSAVVNAEEGVGVSAALDLYNSLKGDPCNLPTISL